MCDCSARTNWARVSTISLCFYQLCVRVCVCMCVPARTLPCTVQTLALSCPCPQCQTSQQHFSLFSTPTHTHKAPLTWPHRQYTHWAPVKTLWLEGATGSHGTGHAVPPCTAKKQLYSCDLLYFAEWDFALQAAYLHHSEFSYMHTHVATQSSAKGEVNRLLLLVSAALT